MLEFVMNSTVTAGPPVRRRLALIVASILAVFGSFVVTAPAQAGYYGSSYYPCSYRCGYPAYRPVYRQRCYSCGGPRLIYERRFIERRFIERQFVERRYGFGGYRRHYGYSPYGYRRNYGYPSYGSYRSARPYNGYGGVGRRWSLPYVEGYGRSGYNGYGRSGYDGYGQSGYDDGPRPPAPISNEGDDY